MEPDWAAQHLQVIRTLMERSAIYRRALAPVMLGLGVLGSAAAAVGAWLQISSLRPFGIFWLAVGVLGVSAAYILVRRQALRASEPFWSPPTRRVTQALVPPLAAGFVATLCLISLPKLPSEPNPAVWLPALWIVFYGCAVHAAGFFMPRGMKLFGWGFIAGGCTVGAFVAAAGMNPSSTLLHGIMGVFFGGMHLAYGGYLCFTEQGK